VTEGFHPLRVLAVERLTADAVAVSLAPPAGLEELFAFQPGQHLTLRRVLDGQEQRRTYSVCVAPSAGVLRIGVKLLPGGVFSGWLHAGLGVGDSVDSLPPAGRFGAALGRPGPQPRHLGAVVAGSGITPVLSILATALQTPDTAVSLLYGNRTTADVMFLDELADLKDSHPDRVHLVHVLSGEAQASPLLHGRLDPERLTRLLTEVVDAAAVTDWFLCGPLGLVTGAREVLLSRGCDPATVHSELFYAGAVPAPTSPPAGASSGSARVTVRLHGRTTTVAVPFGGPSVLEAVLAVRPDAPYACRGGVCGTCRARVRSGEVEMERNYALEPDELAAGLVLSCQSRPVTAEVALDYV
jgi:ring-1,2-phenylacetyl-CoA epoxidase subunit PaaE